MRTVPIASKKFPVRTLLVSEVRWLKLLRTLFSPYEFEDGGPVASGELRIDGIVFWLEKLRIFGIGTLGAVLLRLREWFENRGTVGGSAASSEARTPTSRLAGSSGTGSGWLLVKDGFLPLGKGRGRPLAIRMESRIGLRRRAAVGVGLGYSS